MQGNGAGYLSVTGNMQKAKRCTLSIFNFGSMLVSTLPNFFPLRVEKMLRCSNPWGDNTHPLCKAIPRAPREHTQPACRTLQIPPSRWLCGAFRNPWVPDVFPRLTPLADWCPPPPGMHASVPAAGGGKASGWKFPGVPPGEAIKWLLRLLLSCPEY